ncbi:MAG: hypothetical protein ACRDQX_10920 [Pseudonocardiaceae bacterium]
MAESHRVVGQAAEPFTGDRAGLLARGGAIRVQTDAIGVAVLSLGAEEVRLDEASARLRGCGPLEVFRDCPSDVLRFAHDLKVPPTSHQAEHDLRPSKCQRNVSGRLTSEARTHDPYTIRGYLSTAAKHDLNTMAVLRDALTSRPWIPTLPALT